MSMNQRAEKAGVSSGYLSDVSRGRRNMGVKVQQWVEALLQAPAYAAPAQKPRVDCRALWDRMEAHGISQNEAARRAGISVGYISQVMNGHRTPSGDVLKRLHRVLFAPSPAELVAPVELRVFAWKKGGRNGVVIKGAGAGQRHRSDRRAGALGRPGAVCLHHRLRQPRTGLGERHRGRAGLRRNAETGGARGRLAQRRLRRRPAFYRIPAQWPDGAPVGGND